MKSTTTFLENKRSASTGGTGVPKIYVYHINDIHI